MAEFNELFLKTLEMKLDHNLAFLEESVKQNDVLIEETKNNLRAKGKKLKEMKKEIDARKKGNQEMEKTLHALKLSKNELSDYIELLKSDAEKYDKETDEIVKDQNERLAEAEKKWKTFEAQYETLPLAVVRREEATRLRKTKIELLAKQQKFSEMKKMVRKLDEIGRKQKHNLLVECVELYNENKLEDIQSRVMQTNRMKLEEELRQQNETISALKKKQKERLAAKQQEYLEESGAMKPKSYSLSTSTQILSQIQIPRFDLTDSVHSSSRPSLTLRKDCYDSVSITSSVIDSLMEPIKQGEQIDGFVHSEPIDDQQEQMTQGDRVSEGKEQANLEEEDDEERSIDHPAQNPRTIEYPIATNDSEKSFEMSEMMESATLVEMQGYESPNPNRAEELPIVAEDREYYNPGDEERSEFPGSKDNELIQGLGQHRVSELGEPTAKIPRVSRIEKVHINLPIGEKNHDEDPLRQYYAGTESNGSFTNSKPSQRLSSLFSNPTNDYQGGVDAEVESNLGSESSMGIDDIMKQYRVAFSPEQSEGSGTEEYHANLRDIDNRTGSDVEPQADPSARPARIGKLQVTVPFLTGFKYGAPTSREGPKKDSFFLSMF